MDLTRRDLIKSLAALPLVRFVPGSKKEPEKLPDYSNFGSMFTEINFDEFPNGLATFSKPYEIDGLYYTDVKYGIHDYKSLSIPLNKEVKITDEECMKMVLCSAFDRNIVVFDSDAIGYSDRLTELMLENLYENHTLYSKNKYFRYVRFPFDESELIHFDDNMMDYAINKLGARFTKKFTRFCVGIRREYCSWLGNVANLPFYKIKYRDYYGLTILDNENMILGMY